MTTALASKVPSLRTDLPPVGDVVAAHNLQPGQVSASPVRQLGDAERGRPLSRKRALPPPEIIEAESSACETEEEDSALLASAKSAKSACKGQADASAPTRQKAPQPQKSAASSDKKSKSSSLSSRPRPPSPNPPWERILMQTTRPPQRAVVKVKKRQTRTAFCTKSTTTTIFQKFLNFFKGFFVFHFS